MMPVGFPIEPAAYAGFALLCLGMVLTPGPNLAYLVSRSVCQGRQAGFISLAGIGSGFLVYLVLTVAGVAAVLAAMPGLFGIVRVAGAAYLGWMAWTTLRPGGRSPFQVRDLPADGAGRLYAMGLMTALLNPKVAVLYLSLLPQFVDPAGSYLVQGTVLGLTQIAISVSINMIYVIVGGAVANLLVQYPGLALTQRFLLGAALAGLSLHLLLGD